MPLVVHMYFRNVFIVTMVVLHLTDISAKLKCQLPRRLPVELFPFPKAVVTMYCCAQVVELAFPCHSGGIRALSQPPVARKGSKTRTGSTSLWLVHGGGDRRYEGDLSDRVVREAFFDSLGECMTI